MLDDEAAPPEVGPSSSQEVVSSTSEVSPSTSDGGALNKEKEKEKEVKKHRKRLEKKVSSKSSTMPGESTPVKNRSGKKKKATLKKKSTDTIAAVGPSEEAEPSSAETTTTTTTVVQPTSPSFGEVSLMLSPRRDDLSSMPNHSWETFSIPTQLQLFEQAKGMRRMLKTSQQTPAEETAPLIHSEVLRGEALQSLWVTIHRVSVAYQRSTQNLRASYEQISKIWDKYAHSLEDAAASNSQFDTFSHPGLPPLARSISEFCQHAPVIQPRFAPITPFAAAELEDPTIGRQTCDVIHSMLRHDPAAQVSALLRLLAHKNDLVADTLTRWLAEDHREATASLVEHLRYVARLDEALAKYQRSRLRLSTLTPRRKESIPIARLPTAALKTTAAAAEEQEEAPHDGTPKIKIGSFIRKRPQPRGEQGGAAIRLGFSEKAEKKPAFKELIEKEKDYLFSLISIVRMFLVPLRQRIQSSKGMDGVSLLDTEVIFGNVEQIYRMHELALRSLEACVRDWKSSSPGSVFWGFVRGLEIYRTYISNLFYSDDRLVLCLSHSKALRDFIKQQESTIIDLESPTLQAFLQSPVKHLEYLHSTSKKMAKLVGPRDMDFSFFSRSRKFIKQLLLEIESQKQKPMEFIELIELRERLIGWPGSSILQPGRQFVRAYDFVTANDDKQQFHFIVCSDLLLVTHKKGKKTDKLIYDFSATPPEVTLNSIPDSVSRRHCFSLTVPSLSGIKLFLANSQQEKERFFGDVLKASGVTCIFGKPLSELDKENGVPILLLHIASYLRTNLKQQGIFRENGNANQI
ncbi:MAG: hypothetical protein Q8P67_00505, partial [archaeon]|nr:hypothetical protein [archaeon]